MLELIDEPEPAHRTHQNIVEHIEEIFILPGCLVVLAYECNHIQFDSKA